MTSQSTSRLLYSLGFAPPVVAILVLIIRAILGAKLGA